MKKLIPLVVMSAILLTGCGQNGAQMEPVSTASVNAELSIKMTDVVGLTLDKATDQLKDLGLKVDAKDVKDDKTIISKKNWKVVSQDPAAGTSLKKGDKVELGVHHLTDETPSPTPTPTQAPVPLVAPPAPEVEATVAPVVPPVVAEPAPVQPAPVQPAPQQAPVQQAPVQPAPVQPAPVQPAPAAPYYANCAAVKAAGAAPIHISQPGYGKHLDKDGDGWGCDK